MKQNTTILIAVVVGAIALTSCSGSSVNTDVTTDATTQVKIGNQYWATTNLGVSTFRNGDSIPEAKTAEEWLKACNNKQPAWCYYDNDPANGSKYGKMYNWYAVSDARGLAPKGFHIPSDAEWTELTDFLGGDVGVGTALKSTTGWNGGGNGSNSTGFSALPGGSRLIKGSFDDIGNLGVWWSSTEFSWASAWSRELGYKDAAVGRNAYFKAIGGLSVRCIRD